MPELELGLAKLWVIVVSEFCLVEVTPLRNWPAFVSFLNLSQNFYSTILLTVFYKSITCALQGQGFFLTYHFPTRTLTIKSQMAISKLQNHRQDLERGYDLSRKDIDDRIAPSSCIVLEFFHAYALIRILVC